MEGLNKMNTKPDKWIAKSMTIWGSIITFLPVILPALGIDYSAETNSFINEIGAGVISAIGVVITWIGRIRAGGVKLF